MANSSYISLNIRHLRVLKKMTLAEAGEALGLSGARLQTYETGKRNPSTEIALKMAEFYNVPLNDLLTTDLTTHQADQSSKPHRKLDKSDKAQEKLNEIDEKIKAIEAELDSLSDRISRSVETNTTLVASATNDASKNARAITELKSEIERLESVLRKATHKRSNPA